MRIGIVASEAAPFAKTGGLADVTGALPKTLFRLGHEPFLVMPLYRAVRESNVPLREVGRVRVPIRRVGVGARVFEGRIPGTEALAFFIGYDGYYDRPGLYGDNGAGYPDNCERFAFLSRAAIEVFRLLDVKPDVVHLHDWQTALVAPYLRILYKDDSALSSAGVVLTIHNMAYQGVFWHLDMETIGIDWSYFTWKYFEYWGNINLLKAGIVFADVINTVSPAYAREIETPAAGHGLEGALRDRDDALHGVVNGIDDAVWNPAADPHLPKTYGPEDFSGKAACKRALQRQVGLPQRKAPVLGVVSRFAEQKGLDLVAAALPRLFDRGPVQCVILGDGDDGIAAMLRDVAARYPARLSVTDGYDERLAHRIIAGADMVLVPSRFEPCGLTQLYGLKYGTIPVVRRTGGLADTVIDCTPANLDAGKATGFVFENPTPDALTRCIERALALFRDRRSWERLIQIAMTRDWSWERSTRCYLSLYAEAMDARKRA